MVLIMTMILPREQVGPIGAAPFTLMYNLPICLNLRNNTMAFSANIIGQTGQAVHEADKHTLDVEVRMSSSLTGENQPTILGADCICNSDPLLEDVLVVLHTVYFPEKRIKCDQENRRLKQELDQIQRSIKLFETSTMFKTIKNRYDDAKHMDGPFMARVAEYLGVNFKRYCFNTIEPERHSSEQRRYEYSCARNQELREAMAAMKARLSALRATDAANIMGGLGMYAFSGDQQNR